MTNEEIKEIKEDARLTRARLALLETRVEKLTPTEPNQPQPEPWKRWSASASGETYYVVHGDCMVMEMESSRNGLANYLHFKTRELAERHAKRLRSMVPTCAMPKVGDTYWSVSIVNVYYAHDGTWKDGEVHHARYHKGLVFITKESAEAWIAEFGDVWTTRVDGEGE